MQIKSKKMKCFLNNKHNNYKSKKKKKKKKKKTKQKQTKNKTKNIVPIYLFLISLLLLNLKNIPTTFNFDKVLQLQNLKKIHNNGALVDPLIGIHFFQLQPIVIVQRL